MIGAQSSKVAIDSDPAFVITPITKSGLKFWIGNYSSRAHYVFNTQTPYEERWDDYVYGIYNDTVKGSDEKVITKVNGDDSGMTMSWVGVSAGGTVEFMFSVGDVASTGAVGGNLNYADEYIEGLDPNAEYTITCENTDYTLTADGSGRIPFKGTGYDFIGKTITIKKGTDTPTTVKIAARPTAEEISSEGTQDEGNADKPADVGSAVISTTSNSITINVGDITGQEYRLYDAAGNEIDNRGWIEPVNGIVTFDNLEGNTTYTVKARKVATSSAPASEASTGVQITTKGTVSVTIPENRSISYDGNSHAYPVTATPSDSSITYSLDEDVAYADTVPSVKNVGTYTIYYKAEKDTYRTAYGSFTVTIAKGNRVDNNRKEYTDKLVISSDASTSETISISNYLEGLLEDDIVTLVRNGNSSNNFAVNTGMTGSVSTTDKTLTYSIGDTQEGTTGNLLLYVENPNYNPYYILIPVETAPPINVSVPDISKTTTIYDGKPHSYPITTDDETAEITYSTEENGEYTSEAPTFKEPGVKTVYYKITRPGKKSLTGSYTVNVYPNPVTKSNTIEYDGNTHKFPLKVDDESVKISYSLTADGEYTNDIPSFKNIGQHVVYYKIEREGQAPAYGSYVVRINAQQNSEPERKNYPVVKNETIEEKKTEEFKLDESVVEQLIPTVVATVNEEPVLEDETTTDELLGKGNIIDKGDIWSDMTSDTKVKLLEKLDEKGGEIIKASDLLYSSLDVAKAELRAEANENGEEETEKIPVKDTPVALVVGEGAVVVSLENSDSETVNAGLADAKSVALSLLTEEQYAVVAAGSIIDIKVEVTPLEDESIPELDKEVIETGLNEAIEQHPNITMADYVDISMFLRIDDSEWNQLTEVDPIDIVIDLPKAYRGLSDKYFIMRAHEGVSTLLEDKDSSLFTITISTGQFSTYALMYNKPAKFLQFEDSVIAENCGLCHICPTFLGVCYFVWVALIAAVAISFVFFYRYTRRNKAFMK